MSRVVNQSGGGSQANGWSPGSSSNELLLLPSSSFLGGNKLYLQTIKAAPDVGVLRVELMKGARLLMVPKLVEIAAQRIAMEMLRGFGSVRKQPITWWEDSVYGYVVKRFGLEKPSMYSRMIVDLRAEEEAVTSAQAQAEAAGAAAQNKKATLAFRLSARHQFDIVVLETDEPDSYTLVQKLEGLQSSAAYAAEQNDLKQSGSNKSNGGSGKSSNSNSLLGAIKAVANNVTTSIGAGVAVGASANGGTSGANGGVGKSGSSSGRNRRNGAVTTSSKCVVINLLSLDVSGKFLSGPPVSTTVKISGSHQVTPASPFFFN